MSENLFSVEVNKELFENMKTKMDDFFPGYKSTKVHSFSIT